MKAGIAAAIYAAEALRRAGVALPGTLEVSGTVDEESGGLRRCRTGSPSTAGSPPTRTDYVIIPEPLDVDRVCIGHRGVYWFEVERPRPHRPRQHALPRRQRHRAWAAAATGRRELKPRLASRRTEVPVVPPGARHATLNVNGDLRRPADGRHPDAVRRRSLPRGVRPPLPARGRIRRDARRDRWTLVAASAARRAERRAIELQGPDGRAPDAHAGRLAGHPGADRAHPAVLGRTASLVASPGHLRSQARGAGSPACRTAWPTARARSSSRISPTRYRGVAELVAATKVIALASLELMSSRAR